MPIRKSTNKLIVHCADTYAHMDIGAREINNWHIDRGWSGIGYHFVVRRDGTVENGRAINQVGAHCKGFNSESIGICLVGGRGDQGQPEDNFTESQMETLGFLIDSLEGDYPDADVFGHNDLNPHKFCPSFDVHDWIRTNDCCDEDGD